MSEINFDKIRTDALRKSKSYNGTDPVYRAFKEFKEDIAKMVMQMLIDYHQQVHQDQK